MTISQHTSGTDSFEDDKEAPSSDSDALKRNKLKLAKVNPKKMPN